MPVLLVIISVFHEHAMVAGIVGLALGTFQTMLVMEDGSVWSSGVDADGRSTNLKFVRIIPNGATAAAIGNYFCIVLTGDSFLWIAGTTMKGHQFFFLDLGQTDRKAFSIVHSIPGAKTVAAGGFHGMALTHEGNVWGIGWNKYGQLGEGLADDRGKFSKICSGVKAIAAGEIHSIVMKQDASVWATGRNYNGQLGDGSRTDRKMFVKVMSSGADSGAVGLAAGGYHSMVLKEDGSVWAAGCNEYGQLGDGSTIDKINFVQVVPSGVRTIAAGSRHSMVLKEDASVWATGYNLYGQLGDGSTVNRESFVQVIPGEVDVIAAGAFHSMVVMQEGTVYATGSNRDGQFGDGSTMSKKEFVRVAPFRIKSLGHSMTHEHTQRSPLPPLARTRAFHFWRVPSLPACVLPEHLHPLTSTTHSTVRLLPITRAPVTRRKGIVDGREHRLNEMR